MFPLLPHNTNQHPLVQFSVESLLPSESWWPLTSFPPAFWSSKFPLEVKFFLQHPRAIPHRQLQTFLHSSHRGFRRPTNYIANKTCFSPFPLLVAVTKSLTKSILRQEGWIFIHRWEECSHAGEGRWQEWLGPGPGLWAKLGDIRHPPDRLPFYSVWHLNSLSVPASHSGSSVFPS